MVELHGELNNLISIDVVGMLNCQPSRQIDNADADRDKDSFWACTAWSRAIPAIERARPRS